MISSYGTTPAPTAAPITIITTSHSTARSYKCLIHLYRYFQFVLNVICVAIAGYTITCFYPTPGRIFFTVVTTILTAASFALVIWYCVISARADFIGPKPIYEAIYYSVCFLLLTAAYAAVLAENDSVWPVPLNYHSMNPAVGTAIFNTGFYLGSSCMFWKIARTS